LPTLAGATITIVNNSTGLTVANLTADANGLANTFLNQGTYTVTISKAGYQTTQYTVTISFDNTQIDFNLPVFTGGSAITPLITLTITETLTAVDGTKVSLAMTETLKCNNGVAVTDTMTETLAFGINSGVWKVMILIDNYMTPCYGTINPAAGVNTVNSGNTLATTATTRQYSLYGFTYLDNSSVNVNGNAYELVNTAHPYTIAAQTVGTLHAFFVVFYGAWEVTLQIGGSSNGTLNFALGTYEVKSGSGFANITATPNGGSHFVNWTLDGVQVSTNTTYACPVQGDGTSHVLSANFATP
jgi:hypothetical protein